MDILIISGMSGAGKSRAAGILEDLNFYCVDNMPVELMPRFVELCLATRGRYERVALVTDVRGQKSFDALFTALDELHRMGCVYKILYVCASIQTIVKRYKETRRRHPLDPDGGNLESAVMQEVKLLEPVRDRADYVVDTSSLTLGGLQRRLADIFLKESGEKNLHVNVISFGYKHGLPIDADIVFDVRFLPNPYYVPELREKTGLDKEVADYVFSFEQTGDFLTKFQELIEFLLPNYQEEGKSSLVIGIGCTGGHHRSVAIACAVAEFVRSKGYQASCIHRDVDK